jgi:short-subunit dehydrogenase
MNKTVIITGGTTGIGKATAIHFAKNGYNVVVTSRNADKETSVIADFKENGVDVTFFPLDERRKNK